MWQRCTSIQGGRLTNPRSAIIALVVAIAAVAGPTPLCSYWLVDGVAVCTALTNDIHGNESGYALLRPEDVTGGEAPRVPEATYLAQNFPNPFNPAAEIGFWLAAPARVRLRIYDAAELLLRELIDEAHPAARYE